MNSSNCFNIIQWPHKQCGKDKPAQSLTLILPFLLPYQGFVEPNSRQEVHSDLTEKVKSPLLYLHDNLLWACPENSKLVKTLLLTFCINICIKSMVGDELNSITMCKFWSHTEMLLQRKDDVYKLDNNIWFSLLPSQTEFLLKPVLYKQVHKFKRIRKSNKKDDTFKKSKCLAFRQKVRWSKRLSSSLT